MTEADVRRRLEESKVFRPGDQYDDDNLIPLEEAEAAAKGRPEIRVRGGSLSENASEGEAAIIRAGLPIYRRGSMLVRPTLEEADAAHGRRTKVATLARVDAAHLRDLLCQSANWVKYDVRAKKWQPMNPPADVAMTIGARYGEWRFLPIAGVITTPTLRPDGSILDQPGYDPATRFFLMAPPVMPWIPEKPTREDAEAALALLSGLLDEFTFSTAAARSVGLSALITPVVRGAFPTAPLHAVRAPDAGSGKSYLVDVAAAIAIGQAAPVMSAGKTEEELEKRLHAALLDAQPIVSIDNLNGELSGDALCQAIERPVIDVRILGKSERVRIEPRSTTWFATGCNLVLVGDVVRRVLLCSLDPMVERPETRAFRRNPVAEVLADRGAYIAAAITIARAYIAAGRPGKLTPLASFADWSDLVRGALVWLGQTDPVATMEDARAEDPRLNALRDLFTAWESAIGTDHPSARTVAELLTLIDEKDTRAAGDGEAHQGYTQTLRYPEMQAAVANVASIRGRIDGRSFGRYLSRNKGRIIGGLRLCGEISTHGNLARWWLECLPAKGDDGD